MAVTFFLRSLILVILACAFSECKKESSRVDQILKLSGSNREELEKVIRHYQKPEDSLKLRAAYFLIENMADKYSVVGEGLEKLNAIFPQIENARERNLIVKDINSGQYSAIDSIWDNVSMNDKILFNLNVQQDLNTIKSDFLIENIEYSFKVWNLPWTRHLSFEEFCEYILPYRISEETLQSWRSVIYNKYKPLLDSLTVLNLNDPVKICRILNKKLLSKWVYCPTLMKYPVAMTADNLIKANMGSCKHQAALATFIMRALGVPVVYEQVPHYGNRSLGHHFNGVLSKNGKFIDFEAGDDKRFGHVLDSKNDEKRCFPKIFRENYALSNKSLFALKPKSEEISSYFMNPYITDVTAKYLSVADIKIKLTGRVPENCSYTYLCVFDNKSWQPIAWSKIIGGECIFENMGRDIVYMPMYYSNRKLIPASFPVILDKFGSTNKIIPVMQEQKMILNRKYKPDKQLKSEMINSVFQASNTIDFKRTIDLYCVKDSLELIQKSIVIQEKGKYRFVRYKVSERKKGYISEISFLSQEGIPLNGKIITSTETSHIVSDNNKIVSNTTIKNAFDNDILSFAFIPESSTEQWIGLDLGKKRNISTITFCPRTDKNDVWPGLNYELFYWNNTEWKSLGIKKALKNSLEYKSHISGTLFLLKCLDEGEEERIFIYKNGKQIWW